MSKITAEQMQKIEIWWLLKDMKGKLQKEGGFTYTYNYEEENIGYRIQLDTDQPYILFIFSSLLDKVVDIADSIQKVHVTKTSCHFGKHRYWFNCPSCNRRVGVLYRHSEYFVCRHCKDLTYLSRNISSDLHVAAVRIQIDKLEKCMKRHTWRGRPTRKQRRLDRLYDIAGDTRHLTLIDML